VLRSSEKSSFSYEPVRGPSEPSVGSDEKCFYSCVPRVGTGEKYFYSDGRRVGTGKPSDRPGENRIWADELADVQGSKFNVQSCEDNALNRIVQPSMLENMRNDPSFCARREITNIDGRNPYQAL
jgi:hypothetical protein